MCGGRLSPSPRRPFANTPIAAVFYVCVRSCDAAEKVPSTLYAMDASWNATWHVCRTWRWCRRDRELPRRRSTRSYGFKRQAHARKGQLLSFLTCCFPTDVSLFSVEDGPRQARNVYKACFPFVVYWSQYVRPLFIDLHAIQVREF